MDEGEIQEYSSLAEQKKQKQANLVSIRTKLVAPNNLLPGSMIRSQAPLHLLKVKVGLEGESGHQMLLDEVAQSSNVVAGEKNKNKKPKNVQVKLRKGYSRSQIVQIKIKQKDGSMQARQERQPILEKDDPLSFLGRSIKNVHRCNQQLVFVSKTVLLEDSKIWKGKLQSKNQEQTNKIYLKCLNSMQYYGAVTYAYDTMTPSHISQLPEYKTQTNSNQLEFDDDFESSNLLTASKIQNLPNSCSSLSETYIMTVRLDYNTRSYGQWFYFKLNRRQRLFSFDRKPKHLYKFMLINMTKSSSMFGLGLKISVCRNGIWRKEGTNISYYPNNIRRDEQYNPENVNPSYYSTLQFTLEIYEGQELYVSYTEPYTFSRVGKLLDKVTNSYQSNKKNIVDIKRYVICTTFLGNNIEVLNVTAKRYKQQEEQKKIIFIVSRCHPVETAGSHVLEGIINTLTQLFIDCTIEEQKNHLVYKLLENYIIKIIPMLNPDGVIVGNSRCNIAGYDMNRSWRRPQPQHCRQIHAIKQYILNYEKRIAMFIDLHAHSKKKNVFAYGCHDTSNPFATREFPFLLSKLSQNDFLFSQCRFARLNKVTENKKNTKDGTARVFLYDVLRIPNVFTIENSYCSAKGSMFHYDKASYQVIGSDILTAISLYFSPNFKVEVEMPMIVSQHFQEFTDDEKQRGELQTSVTRKQELTKSGMSSRNGALRIRMSGKEERHSMREPSKKIKNTTDKWSQAISLRQQYIHELKSTQKNITIGFAKDEASQSQSEQRIYQALPAKSIKTREHQLVRHKKKNSKTADKLINYLNKTRRQENNSKTSQSPEKISATYSEISLNKHHRTVRPQKLFTARKGQIFESIEVQEPDSPARRTHHSRAKRVNTQVSSLHEARKEKVLSIVDIGTLDRNMTTHSYRFNLAPKVEHKYYSRPIPEDKNTIRESRLAGENEMLYNQRREEQIKQYLRKLVRPRQILERRQKLAIRQRTQKPEMKLKQSSIQFSNVKLTRLLVHQATSSKISNQSTTPK